MSDSKGLMSDGYYAFNELYIALCRFYNNRYTTDHDVWKSKIHSDEGNYIGWFHLGIGKEKGRQITYYLHNRYWDECAFAQTLDKVPEFNSSTSHDVLERIKEL